MTKTYSHIPFPSHSPWGEPHRPNERNTAMLKEWHDYSCVAPGIWRIETSSHGGYYVSAERLADMDQAQLAATFGQQGMRGWFEEDCDWCIVVLAFAEEFVANWKLLNPHAAAEDHNGYLQAAQSTFDGWIAPKLARAP